MTTSERVRAWRQFLGQGTRFALLERYHQHRVVSYCDQEYGDDFEMGRPLPTPDDLIDECYRWERGALT